MYFSGIVLFFYGKLDDVRSSFTTVSINYHENCNQAGSAESLGSDRLPSSGALRLCRAIILN